ncbi:MAG TPA: DHA2 family efflux MFS transporter permease subunit [Thermomicrobiales bacterium]|jgi:EmrB/QacA subfamily drug resistance transporter|nr:DHA2 family efflux MFS transporter permease subunit [Thermomicrobiales bacterium]
MSNTTALPAAAIALDPPAVEASPSSRWLILALVSISQLMVVLDATIVNIALPSAQAALGFSNDQRQWIITAYALAFGSLLLLGGRLGDMFGRKNIFLIGLAGFAGASVIGGAAPNFETLVFARALQGLFGALLAPAALSIVTTTFTDPQERGRAFAVFGAISGAGAGVGLLLGGILTEYLDWRWTLYVNVIFATAAIVGISLTMRNIRPSHRIPLDLVGTALVTLGLFGIVYGFSSAETREWTSPITIVSLALGTILVAAFAWWQTRATTPLLPLRIILDRNRGGSMLALLVSGAGMFGVFLFLTYYLQMSLGYSPIRTGLAFLPMVGAIMTSATLASIVLVYRVGARPLIPAGMVMAALGLLYLTRMDLGSTYAVDILPALLVMGVGMGLIFATATSVGTLGVDPDDAGAGSAFLNTVQQVGGSIGTALLSTIAATAATDYLATRAATPEAIAQASIESYSAAYWWSAGLFLVGAILTALILRSGRPQPPVEGSQPVHMA